MKTFRKHGKLGFTLIEIIIILLVIGITASYAASKIISSDADIIAETDQLRTYLRYAQNLSFTNNANDWRVTFSGSTYTLQKSPGGADTWVDVVWPNENAPGHDSGFSISLANGTIIAFDELGSAGPSGGRPDGNSITIGSGGKSRTIVITPNTGFID